MEDTKFIVVEKPNKTSIGIVPIAPGTDPLMYQNIPVSIPDIFNVGDKITFEGVHNPTIFSIIKGKIRAYYWRLKWFLKGF